MVVADSGRPRPESDLFRVTCLWKKIKHLWARPHRMDDQLVPAVEDQYDRLQEPSAGVKAKPQLTRRTVVIEVLDPRRPSCGLDCILRSDTMPQRGRVNPHAEANASRITSERDLPSRVARALIAWMTSSFPLSKTSTTVSRNRPRVSKPSRS